VLLSVGLINERRVIKSVHRNDEVELLEVFSRHTPRAHIGERIPTSLCRRGCPPIGRFIRMIGMCPRRIDSDAVAESSLLYEMAKHAL